MNRGGAWGGRKYGGELAPSQFIPIVVPVLGAAEAGLAVLEFYEIVGGVVAARVGLLGG